MKEDAPALLEKALRAPSWQPEVVAISGVTDPYQPVERRLRITRGCLAVLAKYRNPCAIITKSGLVTRDIDLLRELAEHDAAVVNVSITSLDDEIRRVMEPRASPPHERLRAVEALAKAGIPVGVMVAPIVPGLTDSEIPALVAAAARAGARTVHPVVLRLPHGVADLFEAWLARHFPDRAAKVMSRVRALRGGRRNDPRFHTRQRGEGVFADQIADLFELACRRAGVNGDPRRSSRRRRSGGPAASSSRCSERWLRRPCGRSPRASRVGHARSVSRGSCLGMLRELVADLEPGRLLRHPEVAERAAPGSPSTRAEPDPERLRIVGAAAVDRATRSANRTRGTCPATTRTRGSPRARRSTSGSARARARSRRTRSVGAPARLAVAVGHGPGLAVHLEAHVAAHAAPGERCLGHRRDPIRRSRRRSSQRTPASRSRASPSARSTRAPRRTTPGSEADTRSSSLRFTRSTRRSAASTARDGASCTTSSQLCCARSLLSASVTSPACR